MQLTKLESGIAIHHLFRSKAWICSRVYGGCADNVNSSPIMQPPERQLSTDLEVAENDWTSHKCTLIDTSSSGRETMMAMCSHHKEYPEWRIAKTPGMNSHFGYHLVNYVQGWDKRTNLNGRRYRDPFRPFSPSPGQYLCVVERPCINCTVGTIRQFQYDAILHNKCRAWKSANPWYRDTPLRPSGQNGATCILVTWGFKSRITVCIRSRSELASRRSWP